MLPSVKSGLWGVTCPLIRDSVLLVAAVLVYGLSGLSLIRVRVAH